MMLLFTIVHPVERASTAGSHLLPVSGAGFVQRSAATG
jgi:hypothetical protein